MENKASTLSNDDPSELPKTDCLKWSLESADEFNKPLIKPPTKETSLKIGRLALRFLITGKNPIQFHAKYIFAYIIGYLRWDVHGYKPRECSFSHSTDKERVLEYPLKSMMSDGIVMDIPDGPDLNELLTEFRKVRFANTDSILFYSLTTDKWIGMNVEDACVCITRYYVWISIAMEYNEREWKEALTTLSESTNFQKKYGTPFKTEYYSCYNSAVFFTVSVIQTYLVILRSVGRSVDSVCNYFRSGKLFKNLISICCDLYWKTPPRCANGSEDCLFRLSPLNKGTVAIMHILTKGSHRQFIGQLLFHIVELLDREQLTKADESIRYFKSPEETDANIYSRMIKDLKPPNPQFYKTLVPYLNAGCMKSLLRYRLHLLTIDQAIGVNGYLYDEVWEDLLHSEPINIPIYECFKNLKKSLQHIGLIHSINGDRFYTITSSSFHAFYCRIYNPEFHSCLSGKQAATICYRLISVYHMHLFENIKRSCFISSYIPTEQDEEFIQKWHEKINTAKICPLFGDFDPL